MKLFKLSILLMIHLYALWSSAQGVEGVHDKTSLKEVLLLMEQHFDVNFAYSESKINGISISVPNETHELEDFFTLLRKQTPLEIEKIDNQHFLIFERKGGKGLMCGYLLDSISMEPIAFANVFTHDMQSVTSSNIAGYFELNVKAEDTLLIATYLGYSDRYISLGRNWSDCPTFTMSPSSIALLPVILIEYLSDGISQKEGNSTVVIEPEKMSILPGGAVDKDVLSAIQFLPGINSPVESFDNISVRGGTTDQNLILWDEIPIYHTSHFFGNISAFNPFIIDEVEVIRSGIGSEHGGRVSSVININSQRDLPKQFSIGAGMNWTHAHLELDIPLWKNSALWLSSRRSITDIWSTPTFLKYADKVFQGTKVEDVEFNNPEGDKFRFNDANFKWVWHTKKSKFSISSIGGLNRLNFKTQFPNGEYQSTDILNINNGGGSFEWEKDWNHRWKSEFILTNSSYDYQYDLTTQKIDSLIELPFFYKSRNYLEEAGLKMNVRYKIKENQMLNFGYQYTENNINVSIERREMQLLDDEMLNFKNQLHALFGEYKLSVPDLLTVVIGLRHQRHAFIKNDYFEPRISISSDVTDHLKLKAGTGKHFQFVSQLVTLNLNNLGLSDKIWVASNTTNIPVIESNHWMGGFLYNRKDWTIDVEGYVKELAGITSLSSNLEGQPFSQGNSRIRGIDVLVKKRFQYWRSWVSYTLSETLYEFPSISETPFRAPHDQTHVLQWVNVYRKKNWEFSLGVLAKSGLPFTDAKGVEINANGNQEIAYGFINDLQLDPYLKIDASAVYNFDFPDKCRGFLGIALQNMTNRKNILERRFLLGERSQSGLSEVISIDELGLFFTPNITANIVF